jgi:redox-sensitive bicupin YhaK (pirin superfamily)
MIKIRQSEERGLADHGWLKSRHSFSFADYHDPAHMGWGNLRVINEDRIAPGTGFGTHGHRDMEIISYVLEGELAHQDSMGNVVAIPPGDVQRMSAGRGVMHSEFNHAEGQSTHFLQIWIEPNVRGIAPSYEQKSVPAADKRGRLRLIAAGQPEAGAVRLHADAAVYAGCFDGAEAATLASIRPARPTCSWRAARSTSTATPCARATPRCWPTKPPCAWAPGTMPRCWSSTWPPDTDFHFPCNHLEERTPCKTGLP